MSTTEVAYGLKGIVVLESKISDVDGPNAALYYRGYHIDDLVAHATYEEVAYLLLYGELPTAAQLSDFKATIVKEYDIPQPVIGFLQSLPKTTVPMDMLRTGVSALAAYDQEADDTSQEATLNKAIRLIARVPILVAQIGRIMTGKRPIKPKDDLGIAANFLYILNGFKPTETATKTLDCALTLHAEHGLNASTFAARVTSSTMSDIYSSITTGIGTLKGPLHGGANEAVMRMLIEIGTPDRTEAYIRKKLDNKEVIMGIGHAVYKNGDPRVKHLKDLSTKLNEQTGTMHWIDISETIQRIMLEEKGLHPNVDFFSASAYHALGIDPALYTPVFAASRTSGWSAHVLEQMENNVLIRPQAAYVGHAPRQVTQS